MRFCTIAREKKTLQIQQIERHHPYIYYLIYNNSFIMLANIKKIYIVNKYISVFLFTAISLVLVLLLVIIDWYRWKSILP